MFSTCLFRFIYFIFYFQFLSFCMFFSFEFVFIILKVLGFLFHFPSYASLVCMLSSLLYMLFSFHFVSLIYF